LAVAVLLLGLWPAPLIEAMEPTLQALADHMMQSKL
jgi:NADH:ubiquinone oxidoreductase subunit 4 (subunit M)